MAPNLGALMIKFITGLLPFSNTLRAPAKTLLPAGARGSVFVTKRERLKSRNKAHGAVVPAPDRAGIKDSA